MLILTRRLHESIVVADDLLLTVRGITSTNALLELQWLRPRSRRNLKWDIETGFLTIRLGESIQLAPEISIECNQLQRGGLNTARFGIKAPRTVLVNRGEIHDQPRTP